MAAIAAPCRTLENIEYGTASGVSLRMDGFVPHEAGPFPVVILVHGGGWTTGDRTYNVEPLFRPLADAGFAWFSISYRLARGVFDVGVAAEDVAQAVRHIRENARTYNVDPQRIALVGESAGAHLASMAVLNGSGTVAAVVALYCPSDLEDLARTSTLIPAQVRTVMEASGFQALVMARIQALSPIRHVTSQSPPFLLVHGTADNVVPYQQSERLRDRILAVGGTCDLVAVDGGGHGLRHWELSPAHRTYSREIVNWLRRRLQA